VHEECDHIEQEKIKGKIKMAMTKAMFSMISLIFKGIKSFIFNIPSGSCCCDQFGNISFGDDKVSYPRAMEGYFFRSYR